MRLLLGAVVLHFAAGVAQATPEFENMSARLPHHVYDGGWEHFVGGGVAVFDCNNDALPDIFAAGGATPATLIRNTGDFMFEPVALSPIMGVTGAYPIDIDADGLTDLFVMRAGANVILRGTGACGFKDVTKDWLPRQADAWTTAFTAWWEEGARPVFALGNYVDRTNPDGPFEACDHNRILRPEREGIGYVATKLTPGFCPLSILAARDARGRMALRLSNDRHYYVKGGYEQMWDIAERRFLGVVDGWPQVSLWGMGIASRDLNGDGRDEVMLTSMGDQVLQFGQAGGGYRAADFSLGTYAQRPHVGGDGRPSTGWHAEFGDVDNDGRADLFIAKGNVDQMPGMAMDDPNNLLMQRDDGHFDEVSDLAGVASLTRSRGAALVDFDLDGRLDLIVSNRRAPLELYRNVTADTGSWITVDVQQDGGNRNAIGAVITVQTDAAQQSAQHVIGGGHASGQLLPRHFGLGQATTARITVEWPDGTVTNLDKPAGARVVVRKP